MKSKLILGIPIALFLTTVAGLSQTVFFDDTFSDGSTINSAAPVPPGPNFTSYEEISSKTWAPNPSVNANDLQFGIAATTSGTTEIQALFATNAVSLVAPGTDYIQLTIVFTNTSAGLLTAGQGYLGFGLYNSGTSTNYPVPGGLNGTATTSSSTAISANAATWQGYFAQVAYSGFTSAILTRPIQNGPNNNNQDLVTTGSGSESFSHPTGADVGSTVTSSLILGTNVPYTEVLTIALITPTSEAITNSLYATATGTLLAQFSGVATNSTLISQSFNAFAMGWYQKANTHSNLVDISSITVSGHATPVTGPPMITTQPAPLVVATNGYGQFTVVPNGFNITYQWFRNGAQLADSGDVSGSKTSTLIISPAQSQDAFSGNNGYFCQITGAGGYSTNSTTNALILVPVTNLTWTADSGATWDVDTTPSFKDPNNNPAVFTGGDPVVFDDTAINEDMTLSGNLGPASVTVTTGAAYTFGGSGSIVGPCSVVFSGTGAPLSGEMNLNVSDTYSGGTLLTNGIYLNLENYAGLGTGPVTLDEAGGEMEIAPTGSASSGIEGDVIVADDFTMLPDAEGSFGLVFLGNLSGTSGKTLTFNPGPNNGDTNSIRIRVYGSTTVCDANIDLNNSEFLFAPYASSGSETYNGVISGVGAVMQKGSLSYLNAQNTYTGGTFPASGTIALGVSSEGPAGAPTSGPLGTGPIILMPDSTTTLTGSGEILANSNSITIGNPIQYASGTNNLSLEVGGQTNLTLAGPFTFQGNDNITTNAFTSRTLNVTNTGLTTLTGVVSDGGLHYGFDLTGSGFVALNNTETYTGPTTNSGGTLLVNGEIGPGAVVVVSNSFLGGTGTISAPVTIEAGAGVEPGNQTVAGVQGIGKLTITGSLTILNGTTNRVTVSESGNTFDQVTASSIAYGGTLYATNLAGALAIGDSFQVFSTGTESGTFTNVIGSAGPGLKWAFNPANGTLSVVQGVVIPNVPPKVTTFSISGANLNLTATNGVNNGTYYLLGTTNLTLPLSQWTAVATNVVTASGGTEVFNFIATNVYSASKSGQYFTLSSTNN